MNECYFNDWNAGAYFSRLLKINKLALSRGFVFCDVSGLQGLEDMLHLVKSSPNIFAVSDISDGYAAIGASSPRTRRVKTCFIAMRHRESDMKARLERLCVMRELFRQLISVLSHDTSMLYHHHIAVDPRIQFSEIDAYFLSGYACAYFQIAVDYPLDICIAENEWTESPVPGGYRPESRLCACFQHNYDQNMEGEDSLSRRPGHL